MQRLRISKLDGKIVIQQLQKEEAVTCLNVLELRKTTITVYPVSERNTCQMTYGSANCSCVRIKD
jgi:hypothetical protein